LRSIALVIVAVAHLCAAISQPATVDGGLISGVPGKDASITAFKGIPFAAPPVGDLRWRAPKPVIGWRGIRKAAEFGASCMQTIVDEKKPWTYEFMTHTAVSEDCLFLNVWTGAKSASERRPVYVYIHGGANTEGSGAVPCYDGEGLAKKGVVVVTVNYRLGILGFFTHPELTAESGVHSSGNYALLDLIAALHWIHDNIAAFGGNPDRVVIGGQSAGASNVHSLVASPLAKGLFHAAIAESGSSVGSLGQMNSHPFADQERLGARFAQAKGAQSIGDLRKLSWKELTAPLPERFYFGVVIDGYVQPAPAGDMFSQGRANDVPTLTGCNKDEGGAGTHPTTTAQGFQEQARRRFADLASDFLALYPAATDEQARAGQNESSRDLERSSAYLWAVQRAQTAKTKVYTYFWDHALPGPDANRFGAFHSSEIPYAMNTLDRSNRPFTDADRRIAATVSDYWVNFIRTGDPNSKGLAHWPSTSEQPGMTMDLGDTAAPTPVAGDKVRLAFYEKYFSKR